MSRIVSVIAAVVLAWAVSVQSGIVAAQPEDVSSLREAAARGDSAAMLRLAYLYSNNRGAPPDHALAANWFAQAAARGNATAMFFLGVAFWSGRGVNQDFVEAYKWLDLSVTYAASGDRQRNADARTALSRAPQLTVPLMAEALKRAAVWRAEFERQTKKR